MDNHCPICQRQAYQSIRTKSRVRDTDNFQESTWLMCFCGCVFNTEKHDNIFNEEYRQNYSKMKGVSDRLNYYLHVYGPIIEELTYGRKALDVGYCIDANIKALRDRGWLATGIDLIRDERYITGDFLTYDFGGEKFDFIKMTDFLQVVPDPLKVLKKAYDLLEPSGVLFITTPDTDMISDNYFPNWGHWNARENRQFINESILRTMLSRCPCDMSGNMDIKLIHRDISRRFVSWNTLHLIAYKNAREKRII